MINNFIKFLKNNFEKIFDFSYIFIVIIFLLWLTIEILKYISLAKLFVIFIIFSFIFFLIKIFLGKNEYFINFFQKNKEKIFYSSLLLFLLFLVFSLFYPKINFLIKYFFGIFIWIYLFLKFFGLKINFKSIKKISFFSLTWFQIFSLIFSFFLIFTYKTLEKNNKTFSQIKKYFHFNEKKLIKKKEIKKEDEYTWETLEEKLKKLEEKVNARNKKILKEKQTKNSEKNIEKINFEENIYPWNKEKTEQIKKLQKFLKQKKYYSWEINWKYDEKLKNSLKKILIEKCDWPEQTKWYLGPNARECLNSLK